MLLQAGPAAAQPLAPYQVQGDAIAAPLAGLAGDAARGRAIVASRQQGLCLLCHGAPIPEERFQGDLAPHLAGAGARFSTGQLRLRLVEPQRLAPGTLMPAYYRTEGLQQVGAAWRGKPLLDAQQIEDVVAYLSGLKEPAP
ncbi:sulfur oxidation c-type cytochrome SoxX [Pseudorhodoferax sp. Leaf274]|nr:sulfur oxidation c-type cytochrome SoxX [Pseudorhodoferax sp. Leaf274]